MNIILLIINVIVVIGIIIDTFKPQTKEKENIISGLYCLKFKNLNNQLKK